MKRCCDMRLPFIRKRQQSFATSSSQEEKVAPVLLRNRSFSQHTKTAFLVLETAFKGTREIRVILYAKDDPFYGRRGRINARELWEQMNACSCLNLILACIVYWQACEISRVLSECDPGRQWNRPLPAGTRQPHRVG
jgi:Tn3 transposase DDE domain